MGDQALRHVSANSEDEVSDELHAEPREHFSEAELVKLSLAIVSINTINGWNRLAIGFRANVGSYEPDKVGKLANK